MKIDNKDHLSPADLAEASCNWSWAELGNSFALIVIVISLCFAINGIAMKTKFTLTNPNLHSPQLYFQTIAIIWLNRLSGYFSGWMGGCRLLELILSSASARLNWSWAELGKNYSRGILMQMNNFHFVSFLPFWLEIFADF